MVGVTSAPAQEEPGAIGRVARTQQVHRRLDATHATDEDLVALERELGLQSAVLELRPVPAERRTPAHYS